MTVQTERDRLFPKIVQLNADGMTIAEAADEVGVHPATVTKWQKQTGIKLIQRKGNRSERDGTNEISCDQCGKTFKIAKSQKRRFCSRECTNEWQRAQVEARKCEGCGKPLTLQEGATTMYTYRKYCSKECRMKYGKKKQADPANYVTFTCLTCGDEVTRYRGYGKGHHKYCSNACAQKHTRTKEHIVVEDSVVLDSKWEALFWGLMGWMKIPCQRYDRADAVEWRPGQWYAPDFYMPNINHAVEVKGQPDEHDAERWAAYRKEKGLLVVLGQEELEILRKSSRTEVLLAEMAVEQGTA